MMLSIPEHLQTEFKFGTSTVILLSGELLNLPETYRPDALVVSEDNYLTMQRGIGLQLRQRLGMNYVRKAQEQSPVKAGTIVVSDIRREPGRSNLGRYILHATIEDLDFGEERIDELISRSALSCLEKADDLGLESIAFQSLGSGRGGMAMSAAARCLCSAIKTFLAEERIVKQVLIILQGIPAGLSSLESDQQARRQIDFIREANAVLGTPYDPLQRIRQARDFFGREAELELIDKLLSGQLPGKRHLAVLGGQRVGKWMLLDQVYYRSQVAGNRLADGRFFARLSLAPLLPEKDPAFLLRKLIIAMIRNEANENRREALREAYSDPEIDTTRFLAFLDRHLDCYTEVVFLCDGLPQGVEKEEESTALETPTVGGAMDSFLKTLEGIQGRVRILFTTHPEKSFVELVSIYKSGAPQFTSSLEPLWLRCVNESERSGWVKAIYNRCLGSTGEAPLEMVRFVEEEAGLHPYLISLACSLIIARMKRVAMNDPLVIERGWERAVLRGIAENARKLFEPERRAFFESWISWIPRQESVDLYNLSRAIVIDEQTRRLAPSLAAGDPNAQALLLELTSQGNPRELLHRESLEWLIDNGYAVRELGGREKLSVPALSGYSVEKLGGNRRLEDRPADVVISLLYHGHQPHQRKSSRVADRNSVRTLFNTRGARVVSAEKILSTELRKDFMESFNRFLEARRNLTAETGVPLTARHVFRNVEEVGNFMLSQFATLAVKRYLEKPPPDCSINFLIDDPIKDLPWELMLEAAYAGDIPFRVGRSIISVNAPGNIRPPVRGPSCVKALLIGDPTGDLQASTYEIEWLAAAFKTNPRFDEPDVFLGTEQCLRIQILNALSSGRYGLVHYSGHSRYSQDGSTWVLSDGEVTTDQLTSAAQAAPPAMLFSSSCFSGTGGEWKMTEYENQAFDLPGAFLGAGVEAYIGTLWEVEADAARRLVERFYTNLMSGEASLGECLRRSRQSLKLEQERHNKIDWLAFILYGDPRLMPVDLFPAFR